MLYGTAWFEHNLGIGERGYSNLLSLNILRMGVPKVASLEAVGLGGSVYAGKRGYSRDTLG